MSKNKQKHIIRQRKNSEGKDTREKRTSSNDALELAGEGVLLYDVS